MSGFQSFACFDKLSMGVIELAPNIPMLSLSKHAQCAVHTSLAQAETSSAGIPA
jgi:hypothetical protein